MQHSCRRHIDYVSVNFCHVSFLPVCRSRILDLPDFRHDPRHEQRYATAQNHFSGTVQGNFQRTETLVAPTFSFGETLPPNTLPQ
jgi:hypothetical protein